MRVVPWLTSQRKSCCIGTLLVRSAAMRDMLLLPIVLTLLAVPAIADVEQWPAPALTDEVRDQDGLFEQAFHDATSAGVDTVYAAKVIGRLRRYVRGSTPADKSSALCVDMIVDVVKTTSIEHWTVERASELLIELQKNLEVLGGRCSSYRGSAISFVFIEDERAC